MADDHRTPPGSLASLAAALGEALDRAGCSHALAPAGVAGSLWEEIVRVREQGLLADRLFASYQDYWRFEPPDGVAGPRTLIVVAWPSLPLMVRFRLDQGPLEAVVPPTYIASAERARCLEVVRAVLEPAGHGVGWVRVPVKLLTTRAGLAEYGRNNIAYLPGMGSYARLGALCTDADLGAFEWARPEGAGLAFMKECTYCHACQRACPTGCIPEDGTVIDAARCVTEANENEGDWPLWLSVRSHNSLVGCMRCQEACPVNRMHLGKQAGLVAEFDREETDVILQDRPVEDLPVELRAKLAALDLVDYSTVLGRNLRALRDAAAAGGNG